MTTVSGIVFDTQQGPFPQLSVTIKRTGGVVGFDGGAIAPDTKTFATDINGLLTMPDLLPGDYDYTLSVPANPNTSQTILQQTKGRVPSDAGASMTLEAFLDGTVGLITPTILQQAIDAKDAAEAAAVTAVAAAAGVEFPVSYAPQTLDAEQQAQARQNIGAASDILGVDAGKFGVVALDHGAPEPSIADAVENATALQTAINETAASGKALLLPDGVIWVASYHIRKTGSVALGVDRAGGSVIKMHGAVRREMPLSISSTRNEPQKNINWSGITFDFNDFRRTSRFNTDQEDLYGAENIITFTDEEREAEFGLATDSLLGTCFMVGDANDDWQWSEYRRIIAIDGERHSIDVSAPSDMRGSKPAALGLPTGTATVYDPNPARFVKLIDCEAIGGNDDCITSHHCSHIIFERCIGRDAGGDRVPGNANAVEIDDGSRNIRLLDCMGVRADNALQVKGHNDAPAPYNVYINNFVSINCRYGFELRHTGWYGLQPTDPAGEPVESVDEDGNPFLLTGASETARNVFVNGFHVIAPRETNMSGTIRSAQQAYRLRSYENVILQNISFSDALSDLARPLDGYSERTTSTLPIMQINGGISRLNVDGFTSRGGAERSHLIRIFGTAGVGVKLDNIIATDAPKLGIYASGSPASPIDLGSYDITGDWLDDPASVGVRFSTGNSGSLGYGRVSGYTTEVTWPFSTSARSAAGGGVRGDFQMFGPRATVGVEVPNHGVAELFSYKGNPNVAENDILLLCKADTAGTAFRGGILGHRSLGFTTADTSHFSASIDWVVSSNGSARGRFDIFQLAASLRFDVVQFDFGGVRYLGLRSISSQTGAPLSSSHLYFTGTRTQENLAFTVIASADASNVTPVADITNLQSYRWQHNTGDVLVMLSGTTAQRPTEGNYPGRPYFDTTLGQTIYRNGANNGWVAPTVSTV